MLSQSNRFSVSQALDGFLLSKAAEGRSPKTLADYRYSIGLLVAWLHSDGQGDLSVGSLTTDDLRKFFVFLRQRRPPLSAKTIRNVHTARSSFWSWLGAELGLPHVVRAIKAPKVSPPTMQLPTREQIVAMLKACDESAEAHTKRRRGFRARCPTALRSRTIVLLLLDTGVRAQELCKLNVTDLDLSDGSILVRAGEGGRQRIVCAGRAT